MGLLNKGRRQLLRFSALSWLGSLTSALGRDAPPWHRPDGKFRNNYIGSIDKSFADLRKAFSGERPPLIAFSLAENQPAALRANRTQTTVTWIGHCTILLQVGGLNILTDPHFTERASPLSFAGPRRSTPPGLALVDLPELDIILVSHNHYDHLDYSTQCELAKHSPKARVLTPLGLRRWFNNIGISNVSEHDWWDEFEYGGAHITAVPTQHWSSRSLFDRNDTLWCGWAVHMNDFSFIFIGDSGHTQDYRDINAKLGDFDLAAIPIGAYNPRWFMQHAHQNPEEAVQALHDLGAKRGLATHWGTFQLTFEPMEEPPQRLVAAMKAANRDPDDFMILRHGETRFL